MSLFPSDIKFVAIYPSCVAVLYSSTHPLAYKYMHFSTFFAYTFVQSSCRHSFLV